MTDLCYDSMTKAQVDGVKELIDLCRNGYQVSFSSYIYTAIAYGLRHQSNGRKLTMYIGQFFYEIKENGEILKAVYYDTYGQIQVKKG